MTKANITQYDSTPSNNADINDINIAENCPASNINNAIRELMAHLKNVDTGSQALTALSVTGDLTVDTSTLKVDSTNNRVGIGTASPSKSLHIRTADSSATAESNSAVIIEGTDASRADLQFLGDASAFQAIYFGDNSDADIGRIAYDHTGNSMRFNTNASERMRIDSSGNVGIGTTSMTTGLELHGSDDNACTFKLRDLSAFSSETGPTIAFQGKDNAESFTNFAQIKGVSVSSDNGQLIFQTRRSGAIAEKMRIQSDGVVDITANSGSSFALKMINDRDNTDAFGMRIKCGTDNASGTNTAITFQDGNGSNQGKITFTSGTVSYGTFTAYHPCIVPDADNDENSNANAYPYGTLLEITSLSYTQKDGADTERGILYNVQKSSSAKSKAIIGAYSGSLNGTPSDNEEVETNKHQVSILGDGHILCNNENGNIAVGDYICTSSTSGEGMKATSICATIGIARETVTFTNSTAVLVAVEYGYRQFIPEDIEARITALESA